MMADNLEETNSTLDPDSKDGMFIDKLLCLQELDTDLYMAPKSWQSWIARGTFGGQTVSQALYAASRTVPDGLNLHSMHSYFLRAGDSSIPTIYRVSRTRDGQSFSSRTVSAIQKGKPILTLQASFHNEDAEAPSILEHQPVMPVVKHHSDLLNEGECVAALRLREDVSAKRKFIIKSLNIDLPIEMKPVDPDVYMKLKPDPNHTLLSWVRVTGHLGDNQNVHRCIAAFISDTTLLWAALTSSTDLRLAMTASLDHSMWFHKPIKMNEWMLYETASIQMHTGRPLCHGRLWTEDGQLVASVAQEGIVRGKL